MSGAARGSSFDARIALRPRALDETLDLALAYCRSSLGDFAKLFLTLTTIGGALVIAASIVFDLDLYGRCAVVILISPLLERVVTVFSGRHIFRNEPSIGRSALEVLRRLPLLVIVAIGVGAPLTPMLLTGVEDETWIGVAGVFGSFWPFLLASYAYFSEVALLEQLPVGRAARRTRVLGAHRFGRGLGLVIIGGLIRVLIAGATELTARFTLGFLLQFGNVGDAIGGWPAVLGYLLAGQYLSVARIFDYVDARTRREGWDIQVRFNAIAERAREAEARRHAA